MQEWPNVIIRSSNMPLRKDLKPGTVFRYRSSPDAPHLGGLPFRIGSTTPPGQPSAITSESVAGDVDWSREVDVVWEPPPAPKEVLYDGLTAAQCLARYKCIQQESKLHIGAREGKLTPAQRMAAENEWRKELATLRTASEKKERERVVVDREFEEWE